MSHTADSTSTPPGAELELRTSAPAAGGSAIARTEGRVVFVDSALPGELVRARILPDGKSSFLRAEATAVLEASAHRVPDRRLNYLATQPGTAASSGSAPPLFGGMEYAHTTLEHSRALKSEVITDQLRRIGHIEREVGVETAPGETDGTDWRTRVQLAVDDSGRLGMLAARSHTVVPLSSAPLAHPAIAEVDLGALVLPGADRLEFVWSGQSGSGQSGAVIVRGAVSAAALAALSRALDDSWSILLEGPDPLHPGTAPAHDGRHGKGAGSRGGGRSGRRGGRRSTKPRAGARRGGTQAVRSVQVVRGSDSLVQTVAGRDYKVAADGFWQVHRQAADHLGDLVTAAVPEGTETITDLFCGVGLLGIGAAAARDARLFGIEGAPSAIENARINAAGLDASFAVGRVDRSSWPDSQVVILDPPRAGAGKAVTQAIIDSAASTVVSVSCDAATAARDLAALRNGGFTIESLRAFDLFPLTAHAETLTVLHR